MATSPAKEQRTGLPETLLSAESAAMGSVTAKTERRYC